MCLLDTLDFSFRILKKYWDFDYIESSYYIEWLSTNLLFSWACCKKNMHVQGDLSLCQKQTDLSKLQFLNKYKAISQQIFLIKIRSLNFRKKSQQRKTTIQNKISFFSIEINDDKKNV